MTRTKGPKALPSGPLVGDLTGEATDQGNDGSISRDAVRRTKVVETRRLELLTLSLQRRCSTS